eukprot:5750247-Amphidinium_carterae.1
MRLELFTQVPPQMVSSSDHDNDQSTKHHRVETQKADRSSNSPTSLSRLSSDKTLRLKPFRRDSFLKL